MKTNLVVGCGLSGITMAHRLADELNEEVVIIDTKSHIGGTCYDYKDENGITVHKYGPHIFRTNSTEIWDFLSQFTEWYPFMHHVLGVIDGIEVPIPFNINSMHKVFPKQLAEKLETKLIQQFGYNKKVPILELRKTDDEDLQFLAEYIYQKVFLGYTIKQWNFTPEQLDPSVTGSVPVYISRDDRYFQEKYQGIPLNGYTKMFENMLKHPNIKVRLNTAYTDVKDIKSYNRIFYTGAIEEFFNYKYGKLPYRSLDIRIKTFNTEKFQNAPVVNYPENYDFTRIAEYKYFLNEKSDKTVLSFEYPQDYELGKNDRIYPILNPQNQAIYNRYLQEAEHMPNVFFLGRLGAYRYYDMNRTIAAVFELFNKIKGKVNG
ncbi:MAG: UDP-galactopyranose mutase [Alphaproteobacteria bacterium]|nr:UDP-galactopyranose mutase [Alphaproteobacteria bacterium]